MKPKILTSPNPTLVSSQVSTPSAADSGGVKEEPANKYAALSSYLGSPTHSSEAGSPPQLPVVPQSKNAGSSTTSTTNKPSATSPYPYLTVKGSTAHLGGEHDLFWGPKTEEGFVNVVDTILENRKKLRLSSMGRMYKLPHEPKMKKKRVAVDKQESTGIG